MEAIKAVNKRKLVPKLRFIEFDDEWCTQKLSNFITFISGYAFDSSEMKSTKSKYQLIKMSNVYKSDLQLDRSPSYWDEVDSRTEKFLLRKRDILLTLTGTVGKKDYGYSVVIPENNKFLLNQRLVCLRYIPNISEGDFINNLIKTSHFLYFFFGESKGGTGNQTNVGIEDLRNIKLNVPNLPEQQKIASFLSAIDEKIRQLTSKKELLEQYKKGMMQQLFSGKLRFKDENWRVYPKWEEKTFGTVARFINGKAYRQDELLSEGKYRVLRVGNLFSNNEWYYSDLELDEDKYIQRGDLIYAWSATFGPRFWEDEKVIYHYHIWKVIPNHEVDKLFLFHAFMFDVERIKAVSQGGTMFHITKGNIESRKFKFPCLAEQQKIASYLSSIDTKIERVATQILQTQAFKKGLLQQMFV